MTIDYTLMNRLYPKQKAALTRAQKIADPEARYAAVLAACEKAVAEWHTVGAWPDGWHRWNVALWDASSALIRSRDYGQDVSCVRDLNDL